MKKVIKTVIPIILTAVMSAQAAGAAGIPPASNENAAVSGIIGNMESRYITFEGEVKDTRKSDTADTVSITVEGRGGGVYVYHIHQKTLIFSQKTMERAAVDEIEKGTIIRASYGVNTPMTLSLPPQLSPEVVVIMDDPSSAFVKVDRFDDNFLSSDGELKLNISNETKIVNVDEKPLSMKDLAGSTLLVFYNITTRSLPPQTPPVKVIVLGNDDAAAWDEAAVAAFIKENNVPSMDRDGFQCVKLRDVANAAGYEVTWDGDAKTATLMKGSVTFTFTVGSEMYGYNRSVGYADIAPFIVDSYMYVEMSVIERIIH